MRGPIPRRTESATHTKAIAHSRQANAPRRDRARDLAQPHAVRAADLRVGPEVDARCVAIVGHTSRSGSGPVNDTLSLKRAQYVRQRLVVEAPELAGRTRAEGMGFRQNIVGSGTGNGFDVLDRRVEFKIVPCA
ncbi:MAG TPA: OmpA family protein [Caldimonas sp.]